MHTGATASKTSLITGTIESTISLIYIKVMLTTGTIELSDTQYIDLMEITSEILALTRAWR